MTSTLGVETLDYLPWAVLCYTGFIFAIIWGFTGFGIAKLENEYNIHTYGRENTMSICPPLIITEEQLLAILPKFDEVLTWIDEQLPTLEKDPNYGTAVSFVRK